MLPMDAILDGRDHAFLQAAILWAGYWTAW
jgi:hypothetical protein